MPCTSVYSVIKLIPSACRDADTGNLHGFGKPRGRVHVYDVTSAGARCNYSTPPACTCADAGVVEDGAVRVALQGVELRAAVGEEGRLVRAKDLRAEEQTCTLQTLSFSWRSVGTSRHITRTFRHL